MKKEDFSILKTDLYQLKMAASYFDTNQQNTVAVFEGFVRKLPSCRNFLVVTGLQTGLEILENLSISEEELTYLRELPEFQGVSEEFFNYLRNFKFECDVNAVPEGTILFANEPFIQVKGPIIQAQIVETVLLSVINFSTSVSSKAARMHIAAQGKKLVEFGFRRAHGPEAAVMATRAALIGGFEETSNVFAARKLGVKPSGTMAHSWVMFHKSEEEAFENYKKVFPNNCVILIDTYNPVAGTEKAMKVVGEKLIAVRLDSGDKIQESKAIRKMLDSDPRFKNTKLIVSDDMNEYKISNLMTYDCPINSFGVGTEVVTSKDAPALGGVYKLTEIQRADGSKEYKAKGSEAKVTLPGQKQVYRVIKDGEFFRDRMGLIDEKSEGTPLLISVMEKGKRIYYETIEQMRNRFIEQLSHLPKRFYSLNDVFFYEVVISEKLESLTKEILEKNSVKKHGAVT